MAAELRPNEGDVLRRIEEAVTGAVQRDEPLPPSTIVEQGLLLLGGDLLLVGVDHEPVVGAERLGVQVVELVGIGEVDVAGREHRLELLEARRRPVMAIVAQEEHLEPRRFCCDDGTGKHEREEREQGSHREILSIIRGKTIG